MGKVVWPGGTQLAPVPAVLVGVGDGLSFKYNLVTVAWAGTICSTPPMVSISLRPERYSRGLLESTREFTVNVPSATQAKQVDYCGMVSGRDKDKFRECGFTASAGKFVKAPVVAECPLALECRVTQSIPLGTHILYLGEVLAVQADERFLNPDGKFDVARADILAYAHGNYFRLGEILGGFGFSVRKSGRP